MTAKNESTPFVRACVNLWIAGTTLVEFTVAEVITDLQVTHQSLTRIDLSKAVSNELYRLETKHKLQSKKGIRGVHGCGIGRTPRVYWCKIKFKIA